MRTLQLFSTIIGILLVSPASLDGATNINLSCLFAPGVVYQTTVSDQNAGIPAEITPEAVHPVIANLIESGERHFRFVDGLNAMEIRYDGEITVADDDRSIKDISPGGYLMFSIRTFGNKRQLTISSDHSGHLSHEYLEGTTEVPFESEGREWMEDVLIDVIRSSGIDALRRTNRIYGSGGLDAFLEEIRQIPGNSIKRIYYEKLLEEQSLPSRELQAVAESITRNMSSNSERGLLFRRYADLFLSDNEVAVSYFSAVSRLSSNSERGRVYRNVDEELDFDDPVLTDAYFQGIDRLSSNSERGSILRHTLHHQELTPHAQASLLHSVSRLSSNSEAGSVIREVTRIDMDDEETAEALFSAINRMSSDSEKGSVLRHLLRNDLVGVKNMPAFLVSCSRISSNSERSSVLRSIRLLDLAGNPAITEQYFNTVRGISSSSETGRVLRYTLENHDMDASSMIVFMETVTRLSSSSEKGRVLRTAIPHLIYEIPVLDAYFDAVGSISSSSEQGRTLRALISNGNIDRNVIRGTLQTAGRISSNSELGSVLRAVAPKIPENDAALRDIYMTTAKKLSSDSEYRRAVDAIL